MCLRCYRMVSTSFSSTTLVMPPWVWVDRLAAQQAKRVTARISSTVRSRGGLVPLEEAAHGAAAEDVPGAGGVEDMDAAGGSGLAAAIGVGKVAALGAQGGVHQADTVLLQQLPGTLFGGDAPQKFDLFVADLHDIRLEQTPFDLLFGGFLGGPKGLAQVGVKADELSVLFGVSHGGPGGRTGGFAGEAQGAEVEDLAAVQQGGVQFPGAQAGVGAGQRRRAWWCRCRSSCPARPEGRPGWSSSAVRRAQRLRKRADAAGCRCPSSQRCCPGWCRLRCPSCPAQTGWGHTAGRSTWR